MALLEGDVRVVAYLSAAKGAGIPIVLPTCVIAETYRDDTWNYRAFYKLVDQVLPSSRKTAELAGRMLSVVHGKQKGAPHTIDAMVFAEAAEVGFSHILTVDKADLQRFADERRDLGITIVALEDIGKPLPPARDRRRS